MWFRIRYIIRLFHTLYDVGLIRLKDRFVYILKVKLAKFIPFKYLKYFVKGFNDFPELNLFLEDQYTFTKYDLPQNGYNFKKIKFNFLNKEACLYKNFNWNDSFFDRLWIFNLHYFDWSRKWLDNLIDNKKWDIEAKYLPYLIDYWIKTNNLKSGFGWHSYTISLRVRNWMWLFQIYPNLLSKERIISLWKQLCWLNFNQEKSHGGNHYLENLITLIMVGMQFKGKFAQKIVSESLKKLEIELNSQILEDGGYEERSASYHNLILDRLVELGCFLHIVQNHCPSWIYLNIKKMSLWSQSIRIMNGKVPLFNDSPIDPYYKVDKIIEFSKAFLSKKFANINGLRGHLLKIAFDNNLELSYSKELKYKKSILHLPQTGWTFLRPGDGWELIFKCGKSCPDHLAAHAHSDLLSFDLFHRGKEIICETATSTYWDLPRRNFERSSSAHNTLQMGKIVKGKFKGVEPVDIWSTFRAGKKAKYKNRDFGAKKGWLWVQGSHNGFKSLKGNHLRWITIKIGKHNKPVLLIIDSVKINKNISIESFLHFSPIFNEFSNYDSLNFRFFTNKIDKQIKYKSYRGYYSEGFGLISNRKSIKYSLNLSKGIFAIFTIFSDKSLQFHKNNIYENNDLSGIIDFGDFGKIMWDIKSNIFSIN